MSTQYATKDLLEQRLVGYLVERDPAGEEWVRGSGGRHLDERFLPDLEFADVVRVLRDDVEEEAAKLVGCSRIEFDRLQ